MFFVYLAIIPRSRRGARGCQTWMIFQITLKTSEIGAT